MGFGLLARWHLGRRFGPKPSGPKSHRPKVQSPKPKVGPFELLVRLLYLADIRFPLERANGIQTMQTCHALAARGHHVTLSVRSDTADPPRDPFSYYGVTPSPSLVVARRHFMGPAPWRRGLYLGRAVMDACLTVAPEVVLTRDLGVASLLTRLARGARPPVVYESHGYAPTVRADLQARISGASAASVAALERLASRERQVWHAADAYVTITTGLATELTSLFGPRSVEVIPDGVALPPHRVWTPRATGGGDPVVAYAGHLYPWKGVETLLDALTRLPRVRGLIVGGHAGEPDLTRLMAKAAALGLGARVRFTGMVDPPAVAPLLAEADVLVLPNGPSPISAGYTSPLKLFEYMAASRPIVASDLPAIREVLDDEHAVLVEAGAPDALADGIARLVNDPALGQRLARRAFDAVEQYSWERRAERLEQLLRQITK